MNKKVKVRTILFTEACPLNCRYCELKNGESFGSHPSMTKEQVFQLVEEFNKIDDINEVTTRLLFTGGEPFLYWDWIKEIIEKYQLRFSYSFNTSGYLFTEEILEFLSNYSVSFVLSIDGNEKLTNYLRPVYSTPYHTGYFKQLKKIIPTLLFYFPQTPFRIIINPRYVDMLYEMYLEASSLGFKYFTYILDFESRPGRELSKKNNIIWDDKYTSILEEQFDLIVTKIIEGYIKGISYPRVNEIDKVIEFLLNKKEYSIENLPCQLFNNRTLNTLHAPDKSGHCFNTVIPELKDVEAALLKSYDEMNHQCMKDKNCEVFEYCALMCCPQKSYTQRTGFFDFDDLECAANKVNYKTAIKLLTVCNEICPKASLYHQYINTFNYPGKKEGI